ncbi:MAG: hypothetical protein M4D80_11210 [Myxococcota bacterium]|nr:hypothetical protein [Myxococcota bacterium]
MAGKRGRGGFRPPELRGTLGTLINTALSQAGVVRDAIERGAREGRSRLEDVRTNRKRTDALAELGEIVLELIRKGEIDLGELPEAKQLVRYLDDLDGDEGRVRDGDDEDLDEVVRPSSRKRFDDRDDGTVTSSSAARQWAPRKPSAPQRVWRPVAEEPAPEPPSPPAATTTREPRRLPNNPARKGGIAFDDEDLAEYMHPDDVPPKPSSDGDA